MRVAITLLSLFLAVNARARVPWLAPEFMDKHPELGNEKIIGGSEVVPNSIPYQLSLQKSRFFLGMAHICGATLVSADTAVTAAHCCVALSGSSSQIVAGEHNLKKEEGNERKVYVKRKIVHPGYSPNTLANDICILKLAKNLTLDDKVNVAQLPSAEQDFTGVRAVVSGWGRYGSGNGLSNTLLSIELPVISEAKCSTVFQDVIKPSMICIMEDGKSPCNGDSGGPLTCNGLYCGVVSFGLQGCPTHGGYPAVFTETSYFLDFINKNL